MPLRPNRVLLATADERLRARVAASLTRSGFAVEVAQSVDQARQALRGVDFVIADLALPGGGAFTLSRARGPSDPPVVGLSDRLVDAEVRSRARTCGLEVLLEPPLFTGRVAAALAQVAASAVSARGGGPMRGSLAQWSVADLLALAEAHRWTGVLAIDGPHGDVRIPLDQGHPAQAGAVERAQGWTAGTFELSRSAAAAPEPTVLKPAVLEPAVLEPAVIEPADEPVDTDPDVGVSVAGRSYRRKLSLTPIVADPLSAEPADEALPASEVVAQRRRRSQYGLTAATAASIIAAALLLWWATSSPERSVEVRVLDEVQESRPR